MSGGPFSERADKGFTLLELLIVITILGLILVALTSGVRFAGQAWDVQTRRSERQGDLDAVQNVLRQLITSGSAFRGDSRSLKFVSTLPAALARGGLYDVELRTLNNRLVLAWRPHFNGPSRGQGETVSELTKDVKDFELAYYVGVEGWRHVTSDKNMAPALVRIALRLESGREWPPLVIAPMIESQPTAVK